MRLTKPIDCKERKGIQRTRLITNIKELDSAWLQDEVVRGVSTRERLCESK